MSDQSHLASSPPHTAQPRADDPAAIARFYDRFWRPENRATIEEHDFHTFQHDVDAALAWILRDGGGLTGARVMEIGPGRGRDTLWLAHCGARVTAIDVSIESVRAAREHLRAHDLGHRYDAVVADVAHLPFRNEAFDITLSRFVVAHVDRRAMTPELHRVLCENGRAVLVEPLAHNPLVALYRRFSAHGCRETSPRYLTYGEILTMARQFARGVRHRGFYLISPLALALRGTPLFRPVGHLLTMMELPATLWSPVRRFCWIIVAEFRK